MKKNMGSADRVIRVMIALAIVVLYMTGVIQSTTAIVLGSVAAIMIATSFISFCPLYLPFGISTRKKETHHATRN